MQSEQWPLRCIHPCHLNPKAFDAAISWEGFPGIEMGRGYWAQDAAWLERPCVGQPGVREAGCQGVRCTLSPQRMCWHPNHQHRRLRGSCSERGSLQRLSVRTRSCRRGGALTQSDSCPNQKMAVCEVTDTRRTPSGDADRAWGGADAGQGTPETASTPRSQRGAGSPAGENAR